MSPPPADIPYVSDEATNRINDVLTPQDQARMISRYLELLAAQVVHLLTVAGLPATAGLVSSEITELAEIRAKWDWTRQIRLVAQTTAAAIAGGAEIEKGEIVWPEPP